MADKSSVIRLTAGTRITVPLGLDEMTQEIANHLRLGDTSKIKDIDGGFHLINVAQIVTIEGPE
jgi:hypothetical protein